MRVHGRAGALLAPLLGLTPIVILLLAWQVLGQPDSAVFPPPATWWTGGVELAQTGRLGSAFASTIVTFLVSLVLATALGAVIGAAVGASRIVNHATSPILEFLLSVPPPVVVPVFILIFGVGFGTQIACVIFAAVWPVLLNTSAAMRSIPDVRLDSTRALGMPAWRRTMSVVLPSLLPGISVGVLISAPICIVVTLLVEMLTSSPGAGTLILQAQRSFQSEQMFALLVLVAILGFVVNAVIAGGERLLLRNWPPQQGEAR